MSESTGVLTPDRPQTTTVPQPRSGGPIDVEAALATALAAVAQLDRVPVNSHIFDDLGADSMVMARFCARVRKRPDLPSVAMKDIYQHPTIAGLAAALTTKAAPAAVGTPVEVSGPTVPERLRQPVGAAQYVLCGALQFLAFLGYSYVIALVITRGTEWMLKAATPIDIYVR